MPPSDPTLQAVIYDLRLAVRGVLCDRRYAAIVVATLAVPIGLNVTAFVVTNAMLFRGFPRVKQNDRVVYMHEQYPHGLRND